MTDEEKAAVRLALESYLSDASHRASDLQPLARKHRLLPIFPDWSGFLGLSEDGAMFWVSTEDDDEPIRPEASPYLVHLARIRGAELFPELPFLKPTVGADWVRCELCEGSGRPTYRGEPLPENFVCQCGGLGKLSPELWEWLRSRGHR